MISLKPLFAYLAYNKINKKEFSKKSGIAYPTVIRMRKEDIFNANLLDKICTTMNLSIDQVIVYLPDNN